jgi:pimeloyl-ACP methyl ester carboxylesterase
MEPRAGAVRAELPGGRVTIRWVEWGPADGDPVLCVHGLTRNGRDFDVLAQALAADGRRVICPDMPGRGMSDWLPDGLLYVVPRYLQALAPLLAGLGKPYDWVGTSMGGLIGMPIAANPASGLRRLVLNDIGPFVPAAALARIGTYLGAALAWPSLAELEAHLRTIHAPFGALSDAEWRHLATHGGRLDAAGRWVLHYDPAIAAPLQAAPPADIELWPLWEAISLPTLVLRGAESDLLLPETARRMGQRAGTTVETIPGCGHAPALMDTAQVELVTGFLRG